MKFNGIEVCSVWLSQHYIQFLTSFQTQGTSKRSHISSGIGASCSWKQGGNSNNYITITCTTSTLTQYYVAQYNSPAIHMYT